MDEQKDSLYKKLRRDVPLFEAIELNYRKFFSNIKPNEKCWCGSGRIFKFCCKDTKNRLSNYNPLQIAKLFLQKLKPDDPCWCGSNKLYKDCHMGAENQPEMKLSVVWEHASEEYRKKIDCLAPDDIKVSDPCNDVISAHSVQKTGSLDKIADNNQMLYHQYINLNAVNEDKPEISYKKTPIKYATTFNGMCSKHDDKLFAAIEKRNFISSPEQCFLHAYRALCREIFTKKFEIRMNEDSRLSGGRGFPVDYMLLKYNELSVRTIMLEDDIRIFNNHKNQFDTRLSANDFSDVEFYTILIDKTPDVMCSVGYLPVYDFEGNLLQDLLKIKLNFIPDIITCTSFATDSGGAIVFSWLNSSNTSSIKFVQTLHNIQENRKLDVIVRFLFNASDNPAWRIQWWDNMSTNAREKLESNIFRGVTNEPIKPQDYIDDGTRYVDWEITNIVSNCVKI